MTWWRLAVMTALAGVPAFAPAAPVPAPRKGKPSVDPGLAQLRGVWDLVKMRRGGQDVALVKVAALQVAISGSHWTFQRPGQAAANKNARYEMRLDPGRSPAWIDLVRASSVGMKGIYKVEGDTLTVCYVPSAAARPASFAPAAGNAITMTLKRTRP